ncbi:MAG: alanine--tRNA ligase [bacterium]|nr:alanine--tRNA ligase [bacterium]
MTSRELIKKYLEFFKSKGHVIVPSAPLIPEDDPSALFINSGMHPMARFFLEGRHPLGNRIADVQRCVRTDDIEEVGDATHHTFFEMLGNWSFGDYFKKESIRFSYEFLTKHLNIEPNRLWVTVFAGDEDAPRDDESAKYWQEAGIPKERIFYLGKKDNWWAVGETGPCGPDTEVFYDTAPGRPLKSDSCGPGCDSRFVEIWNNVFMVYDRQADGGLKELPAKNVDTGMGVERVTAVLQGKKDNYRTEVFWPVIEAWAKQSGRGYAADDKRLYRIMADHLRAAFFIIADGVIPSNVMQGYVLRRLIRRALRAGWQVGFGKRFYLPAFEYWYNFYLQTYPEIKECLEKAKQVVAGEEDKFSQTLKRGEKELCKFLNKQKDRVITGKEAFYFYETYGLPLEIVADVVKEMGGKIIERQKFNEAFKQHQQKSRTAAAGMFKGGLASHHPQAVRMHTATHLLQAALRQVLGGKVKQAGSKIDEEKLRFDFTFDRALTKEELRQVEDLVNQKIKEDLPVRWEVVEFEKAKRMGALAFFEHKYDEKVRVYTIGDFSIEVCGGPHVKSTSEVGVFKILKEKSSSAGVRRIYATVETN